MTEKQLKSRLRQSHRWVGVVAAVILFVTGATGILLQHPTWLGPPLNPTLSVAADPQVPGRLLRGTHWGVEQSLDGGLTWRELPILAPPTDVVRIVFAPDNPSLIFVLGSRAMVGSADGGAIWQDVPVSAPGLRPEAAFLDLTVRDGGRLYLLTDVGLLSSPDGGESWAWAGPVEVTPSGNWRRLIHDLHTGHLAGMVGRRVVEGGAVALFFITLTGAILFRRNGRNFRG
jgi:hypothetical protein